MKKGEVRDAVLDELEKLLGPMGFRVKRKNAELVRKISGGHQCVDFALYDYNPKFQFQIMVSVHFDEMRELFFKTVARDRAATANRPGWGISMRHSYFLEGLREYPYVTSTEEIQSTFNDLRPIITEKMIPFLRQCESLTDFERIINAGSDRLMQCVPPDDAYIHIMTSYLANRDRLDEVVKKWAILPDKPIIRESDRENMRELLAYMNGSPT